MYYLTQAGVKLLKEAKIIKVSARPYRVERESPPDMGHGGTDVGTTMSTPKGITSRSQPGHEERMAAHKERIALKLGTGMKLRDRARRRRVIRSTTLANMPIGQSQGGSSGFY